MLVKVERINKKEATVESSLDVVKAFGKEQKYAMEVFINVEKDISVVTFSTYSIS